MNSLLSKLKNGLMDANDDLRVTADDIIEYGRELESFLNDLGTLGTYLNNFEGSLSDFKTDLESKGVEFNTFEIESNIVDLFGSISVVKNDVTGLQSRADDIEDNVDTVTTTLYGSPSNTGEDYTNDSVLGVIDTAQDEISNVNGRVDTVNGKVKSVETVIGDNDSGFIKDLNTAQNDINSAKDSIGDVQNGLYGGEGYSFENPSNDSYGKLLQTTNSDLEDAKTDISQTQTDMLRVEGKVDEARDQIDQSIKYINNVQKIVYGDHTFYYTCNETEWSNISIDTSTLNGDLYVKFLVFPVNDIMLSDVSVVSNGDFNNDLNDWIVTDSHGLNDEGITVDTLTENNVTFNYCRLTSNVKVMILSQENINFTDVDELTFKVKAVDKDSNPLTDITNGLFVYVGDEENNIGLLDTLSTFTNSLSSFQGTLNDLDDSLNSAEGRIGEVEVKIGDENTGIIKQINDADHQITVVDGKIETAKTDINTINNTTIPNVRGQVNDVKTIVSGDPNKPTDKGLVGTINNITNTNGTGSLDIVQNNITDITGNRIPNLQGQIDTTTQNIGAANDNITILKNSVGTVNVSQNGNLQNQVFNINQINDLIKEALNNAFTSPSSLNNNTKYIFIPSSSESTSSNYLSTQEYNIMKYDYGFPMDKVNYFLMRNHTRYYKRNSSTLKYIDEEDLVEELKDYNVVYVCYSLSNSGLNGNLGNDYDNKPLIYNYLYEISSKKYYGLHFGAVPINY